ncbi:hypothetical protein CYMTET_19133 [Cymbomonas tetramitiformis]|uniref:Uncharacterized protein n=1 Tax=Cymbomonas tetramitiformis TaxID=36881 RepID=A0AAE0L5H6_9CHLO|nr:hypothetical protein CYMTET_19133 [Cymbomonas tetramitiformis]
MAQEAKVRTADVTIHDIAAGSVAVVSTVAFNEAATTSGKSSSMAETLREDPGSIFPLWANTTLYGTVSSSGVNVSTFRAPSTMPTISPTRAPTSSPTVDKRIFVLFSLMAVIVGIGLSIFTAILIFTWHARKEQVEGNSDPEMLQELVQMDGEDSVIVTDPHDKQNFVNPIYGEPTPYDL